MLRHLNLWLTQQVRWPDLGSDLLISHIYLEDMVSEGNLAVRRVLQAAENTVSSNTNSIDHVNTPDPRSRIEDMDLMATGTGPQPCVTPPPPISMIIIKFVFQSFSLLY
jgi:hypothetical protein